jgi:hypothetical protein
MTEQADSPWCTRAEAASYLGFDDAQTVDSRLTKSEKFVAGKIRCRIMEDDSRLKKVRLWKADVLAMLPPFEA